MHGDNKEIMLSIQTKKKEVHKTISDSEFIRMSGVYRQIVEAGVTEVAQHLHWTRCSLEQINSLASLVNMQASSGHWEHGNSRTTRFLSYCPKLFSPSPKLCIPLWKWRRNSAELAGPKVFVEIWAGWSILSKRTLPLSFREFPLHVRLPIRLEAIVFRSKFQEI